MVRPLESTSTFSPILTTYTTHPALSGKLVPGRADVLRLEDLLFARVPGVDLLDRRRYVSCLRVALGSTAMSYPVDGRQQFHAIWGFEALDEFRNAVQPSGTPTCRRGKR